MALRFEGFVALRYLKRAQGREEGRGFLRFVTYVSIGGVAIGVAALLLALSIVRGFSREIKAKIIGFGSHVQVENYRDRPLPDATALRIRLEENPQVKEIAPVIQEFALLRRSSRDIDGVSLWGTEALPSYLQDNLIEGTSAFGPDSLGRSGLLLGKQMAQILNASVGEVVTVFSLRKRPDDAAAGGLPRPRVKQFYIAGIYETDLANFDELYAFLPLEAARDLMQYGEDEVTRFDLTLHNIDESPAVAQWVNEAIGFPVWGRSVFEIFRSLYAWVNLQQSIIPLVIGGIVVVGAFNIIGTLLMLILEKTRELGVLIGMGASPSALRRLFLSMGLMIGLIGIGLGEGLALVLALLQLKYDLIPLPAEQYYMSTAPIELHAFDFVIVGVLALLLCALAAYLPARLASRIEPIKAIRFR